MPDEKTDTKELDLAISLLNNMAGKFTPQDFRDEYHEKLKTAIQQKIEGKEITITREKTPDNVVNLMEALTKSLALTSKKAAGK